MHHLRSSPCTYTYTYIHANTRKQAALKAASLAAEKELRLVGAGAAVDEIMRQHKRINGAATVIAKRAFACESIEDLFASLCPMLRYALSLSLSVIFVKVRCMYVCMYVRTQTICLS